MGIAEYAGRPLRWKQTRLTERRYLLMADEVEVATLAFPNAFGSLAIGESSDGGWTFERVGFLSNHITVRAAGSDTDLAVFSQKPWGGGGTLVFPDGRTIRVTPNFWLTAIDVIADGGEPLLHVERAWLLRLGADIAILPAASQHEALPWLVMLACYLLLSLRAFTPAAAIVGGG